jgi:hypothetical protein
MSEFPYLFQRIMQNREEVKFTNIYQGIPVTYTGNVTEVGTNAIRFTIHRNQLFCIMQDGFTYLEANQLPRVVKAKVVTLNMRGQVVLLSNFEYSNISFINRKYVRVAPTEETPVMVASEVMMMNDVYAYRTDLSEISLRVMALQINPALFSLNYLTRGQKVDTSFELRDTDGKKYPLTVKGVIRNTTRAANQRSVRLGIQCFPEGQVEGFLSRYIANRQTEILKAIRELADRQINYYLS